jgi:hypothetical protein
MSEELRERFESLFEENMDRDGLGFYCNSHRQSMWEGFKECAKIKDVELDNNRYLINGLKYSITKIEAEKDARIARLEDRLNKALLDESISACIKGTDDCFKALKDSGKLK